MIRKKSVISLVLLFSLLLSLTYGMNPVFATGEEPVAIEIFEEDDVIEAEEKIEVTEDINIDATELTLQGIYEITGGYTDIELFVYRLYKEVLGREPEPRGFANWTSALESGAHGATVAYGFFFSNEFQRKKLSTDEYISIHYKALLNREPEPGGKTYWINLMESGMPREDIYNGFVNSVEFTNLCEQFGIVRGSYKPPPGGRAKIFITRLYREALGREPDFTELANWTNSILKGSTGAYVAYSFLFSSEFTGRRLNNESYVEALYKSLLNRSPNASETAGFVSRLSNGASRFSIFADFIKSDEFKKLCQFYIITPGRAIDPSKPIIALTFDDGPVAITEQVLDVLEKHNALATFYLNGSLVAASRNTLIRTFNLGNEIGNHGWYHADMTTLHIDTLKDAIVSTNNAIQSVTGTIPATMRPTYGRINQNVIDVATENKMPIINWTFFSEAHGYTENAIASYVINHAKSGDVVLIHDTYADVVPATERIVSEMTARGFQFVTISELLLYRKITLSPGQVFGSIVLT